MFGDIKISPSILSADFMNFERDIRMLERGGTDFIHVDVMDGHFVPNLTLGVPFVSQLKKITDIPLNLADILKMTVRGQTKINLDLHASDDLAWLMRRLIRNIVLGLWVMALLISSSIICTTDMTPKIMGIPAFGVLGYFGALVILMYLFIKHFMKK